MDVNKNNSKANNRSLWIAVVILSVIAVAIWSFDAATYINKMNSDSSDSIGDIAVNNTEDKPSSEGSKIPFEELTKEQAIDAFIKMQQVGYSPNGFVNDSVILQEGDDYLGLLPSYEKTDDVPSLYHSKYSYISMGTDFDGGRSGEERIDYADDCYVVFVVPSNRYRGVSFDKKCLDYERNSAGLSKELTFNDVSLGFAKKALPILTISKNVSGKGLAYVYDYSFKETSDAVSLITYNIGIGAFPYSVELYTMECILDKNTGNVSWTISKEGSMESQRTLVKSFPLSDAELERILKETDLG